MSKKEKVQELANLISIIINRIDMIKDHLDLEFLDEAIGFIVGANKFDKGKTNYR